MIFCFRFLSSEQLQNIQQWLSELPQHGQHHSDTSHSQSFLEDTQLVSSDTQLVSSQFYSESSSNTPRIFNEKIHTDIY